MVLTCFFMVIFIGVGLAWSVINFNISDSRCLSVCKFKSAKSARSLYGANLLLKLKGALRVVKKVDSFCFRGN